MTQMVEELLSGAKRPSAKHYIRCCPHTKTLTEFHSSESLQCPAEITVASFQQNRPEKESKQNY